MIPPVAAVAGVYGRRIRGYSRNSQDFLAEASTVAEETLSGIRTVRFFAQEEFESNRYRRALERALLAARARIRQVSLFIGVASAFGYAALAAVLWSGGRQVVNGTLSVGDLTQFVMYLIFVAFSVAALAGLWGDFMAALGAGRRVFEILDRQTAFAHDTGTRLEKLVGNVEFKGVSFHYPARPTVEVLSNISFQLRAGRSIALIGQSGSGKTTIASLLVRLYDPTQGHIELDGVRLTELEPNWLRRQIGIVSQEPVLISASIAENIRYGFPLATDDDVHQAARVANAEEFIEKFPDRYNTLVGERGIQLSGGQKQRIAIARAVLKNPKILILDEATSALDTESEALVQEALNRLMQSRTTLVIAHRLATIRSVDLLIVMEQGRVIETGSHAELSSREKSHYLRLLSKQITPHL